MIQTLHEKFRVEVDQWKRVFLACFILNLLAYGTYITHITYAVDDYTYINNKVNSLGDGRWMGNFIHNVLCQTSFMPTLTPILGMMCYILTGIGLCKLWSIPKKSSFLIVAMWSLHPYLLDAYNFRLATFGFALSYLLAVAALILTTKRKWGFVAAVILSYFAVSRYQAVTGFAIAAIMIQVLLMSFRENFSAGTIRKCTPLFFRYLLMLGISVAGYLITTKLILMLLDIEANSRLQAGLISDIEQLKAKLCVVATVLFVRLGPVKEFVLPFFGKLAIFAVYLGALFSIIRKTVRLSVIIPVLLWVSLIPLGAISFSLPLESLVLPWRICMGLVVFFAGILALTLESDSLVIRRTGMVLGGFLIVYFIFNNNNILYKQHLTNQKDVFMANRITSKMQSLEEYQPDMDLAIIGRIQKETFSKADKDNLEIVREYIRHCSIRRYSLAKSVFEAGRSKYSFLLDYMGLELKQCSPKNMIKARLFSEDKKPWPDPSSVFIEDDIVVLILSTPEISQNSNPSLKRG
ncbi:MAG: glucosyltransferase domain-containing protein, partial [Planctomycetota bacterium]